jgi:hypothetical protein
MELDPATQQFVDLARESAADIGAAALAAGSPEAAIELAAALASVDADPPLSGARGGAASPKGLTKRATRWYLQYVADQVSAFNQAAVNGLRGLSGRTERLEHENAELRERVAELARRIEIIEGGRDER